MEPTKETVKARITSFYQETYAHKHEKELTARSKWLRFATGKPLTRVIIGAAIGFVGSAIIGFALPAAMLIAVKTVFLSGYVGSLGLCLTAAAAGQKTKSYLTKKAREEAAKEIERDIASGKLLDAFKKDVLLPSIEEQKEHLRTYPQSIEAGIKRTEQSVAILDSLKEEFAKSATGTASAASVAVVATQSGPRQAALKS